ncbi:hypothetical protein BDR04DRAFT_1140468 [Suillus decipiens]|nr:hypothetical protein BDR04DRAFT_1140468 [Suillus decipiens]
MCKDDSWRHWFFIMQWTAQLQMEICISRLTECSVALHGELRFPDQCRIPVLVGASIHHSFYFSGLHPLLFAVIRMIVFWPQIVILLMLIVLGYRSLGGVLLTSIWYPVADCTITYGDTTSLVHHLFTHMPFIKTPVAESRFLRLHFTSSIQTSIFGPSRYNSIVHLH